jgi:hypothetical protein
MNIFVLDQNPMLAARFHCDKHVVKMILESAQMLCTAINETLGTPITPYKSTHKNHPCTKWVSASRHNALWLYTLMECLGEEYTHRYGKQHLTIEKMRTARIKELANLILPDTPLTEFAQAMPDYCKTQTDAVSAYRSYYLNEKRDLLRYTKRDLPYWAEG